jgi:CheY-like chemotaxis protein
MNKEASKTKLFFQNYISTRKILVADVSAVSRAAIGHQLISMGAKQPNIVLVPNFAQAEHEIERLKPEVVICDYDLGKRCGLDLLQKQRLQRPESKSCLFILVTGNSSQSAVAKAAEEDVDTFILKPFSSEVLRNSIMKVALAKYKPSEYMQLIEQGKDALLKGDFEGAKTIFEEAIKLDESPSLAYFYLGQTNLIKQALDNAQGCYNKGLEYNKIHYKCMVGLYEVLAAKQRFTEAYDIVKRINRYFPANPQRLSAVLRLAIMTKSYNDVEEYYRIFIGIDERNDEIVKYVCAALVVCGKYYLQRELSSRAMELFHKAAQTGVRRTKILKEIILTLVEHQMIKEADEFLKKFPADKQNTSDFFASDLLVSDAVSLDGMVLDRGRELLNQNVHDPIIYKIMIKRSIEQNMIPAAEDLVANATRKWPDMGPEFTKVFEDTHPLQNGKKEDKKDDKKAA